MPDGGAAQQYIYRRAVRDKTAPLIMIAGPPGVGKTYSALRLARGMAGPEGKIFFADTDNGRAKFYAEEFEFEHLDLHEPYRPIIFEEAARQAQKQGAAVLVIDNFMHEHNGPGGLLEWHHEINVRLANGNARRLESTKMLAWAEPKSQHKRMRERLYLMNMPVILCCGAERKIAMVLQTEGEHKGKTIPLDQGLVPITGSDIPWAMTISVMLEDVSRPGVPRPIKALLPALIPLVDLSKPLDEATGARIAAWSRGEKPQSSQVANTGKLQSPAAIPTGETEQQGNANGHDTRSGDPRDEPPPPGDDAGSKPSSGPPAGREQTASGKRKPSETEIEAGAKKLAARFAATKKRADHNAIVDNADVRKQIEWLRRNRKVLYEATVKPASTESWKRTDTPQGQTALAMGERR
jgi:DNA polymerase III delta prime subunit